MNAHRHQIEQTDLNPKVMGTGGNVTDFQLQTPVAFIIFNRADTTERVFAEIAKARPSKLLVVGDGPRAGRQGEAEKVAATRAIIQRVDWDCEVLTNFSDVNLGCKKRVSSGIDWIFERVFRGGIDTWDYQWVFANWVEGRSSIIPVDNLISNIGFDKNATHTTGDSEFANMHVVPMIFPLKHPVGMFRNVGADCFSEQKCFHVPFWKRVRNKIYGWLR